jgi:uncharacterized protein (DUF1330 family)
MVYFIATAFLNDTKDNDAYYEYIERVKSIVNVYHGRYLVRSDKITSLSPLWTPDRVIVIEFDTREHLDACFMSEEYRQISALRENSVDSRAIIVE